MFCGEIKGWLIAVSEAVSNANRKSFCLHVSTIITPSSGTDRPE